MKLICYKFEMTLKLKRDKKVEKLNLFTVVKVSNMASKWFQSLIFRDAFPISLSWIFFLFFYGIIFKPWNHSNFRLIFPYFLSSFLNSTLNPLALYFVSSLFRQHFHNYLCCRTNSVEHGMAFSRGPSTYKKPDNTKGPVTFIETTNFSIT